MAMSPRTLRPRASAGYGLDAMNWQSRVIANGGTVSASTMKAVDLFCKSIVTAGIRDRFYRLNLFAGSNLSAALVPLFRGPSLGGTQFGGTTDTNTNFVSGDYVEAGATGGLLGNGTNKRLDTGLAPNDIGAMSFHLSVYQPLAAAGSARRLIGAGTTSPLSSYVIETSGDTTAQVTLSSSVLASGTLAAGLLTGSRISSTSLSLYSNGSKLSENTAATSEVGSASTIGVFARNFSGSYTNLWNNRILAYTVGVGMSESQVSAYYTAMQAFQTALTRNV